MRDFKGMKRQRGRNRGGGGGKPQQNVNRAFDSNGPDNVKIRGHAQHVFEKYQQLARDAFSSGDRVLAENYLQHADHYFRVLRTIQPQRPAAEILGRDVFASGLDIDFEDEGEAEGEAVESGGEPADPNAQPVNGAEPGRYEARSDRPEQRFEGRREGGEPRWDSRRDNGEGRRDERFEGRREDRYDNRREGREGGEPRNESRRDNGDGRREGGEPRYEGRRDFDNRRDNRRYEGRRDDRNPQPRGEGRYDDPRRYEPQPGADPLPIVEPASAAPLLPSVQSTGSEPEPSSLLRSEDGGVSEAPAFLQSPSGTDESEPRRTRGPRRRRPRDFDAGAGEAETAAPAESEEG